MPNTIDFSYVFANAGFTDNVTIYMTIMITFALYVILMVWARMEDRKDLSKLGACSLPDNDASDKYLYEISVFTGDKEGAATESKVYFILSGDDDETGVRSLADPARKAFRKGAKDVFVLSVPRRLGSLNYLRIWHDNSGKGSARSWFLSYIVVKDVQTKERFEFICNKWLAVEKGDGVVDRLIPVAGRDEATQFAHLFHQKSSKNLKDGHLWFSIFMRPPASRFTRVQRVSACMALLYLSMLVNAMWYQRVPPKPQSSAFEIGPFALSPEQIGVGFFSNLIVFPPTFLIVFLFRRSRLSKLRPSKIQIALEKQGVDITKGNSNNSGNISNISNKGTTGKKNRKSLLLPHWCRYIAWFLCVLSMVTSVFFLWAYGISFGDTKTRQWVSSLIVSFFASLLVTQPIKVFLTAIILSTLLKAPDSDVDEEEEDEEEIDLTLGKDEEWLHALASPPGFGKSGRGTRGNRKHLYRPPNLTELEKAKLQRLKEIKMGIILKEIFSYLFFLWILTVLSYGNRDPNAHLMKETLKGAFIDGANTGEAFTDVKTTDDFWSYLENTLIPEVYVGKWYNGKQPFGLRGFVNDRTNRLIGFPSLRQIRIRSKDNCELAHGILSILSSFFTDAAHCREYSSVIYEDRKAYSSAWTPYFDHGSSETTTSKSNAFNETYPTGIEERSVSKSDDEIKYEEDAEAGDDGVVKDASIVTKVPGEDIVILSPTRSKKTEWMYRRPSELDGLPYWGILDMYSGGGYLVPLKGSRKSIIDQLQVLKNNSWMDSRTRAVFAEFSVYNAQVNLFGVVTILAEFQPGGGVIPNFRIDVVRLMRYHQGFGLFVILCELTYVAFILYFTVREFKTAKQTGKEYFKSYWNWAEMLVIFFSYVGMWLYVTRMLLTSRILKVFDRTKGNGYIKLQYVASIDEFFGYIIAFTIFIGILKFIRLLRFNKRMGILYSTLAQCSKDLKSFCIVFCVVFFAFVQMFYLLFGIHMKDFGSFVNSAETTFGMMTGKFDFDAMVKASPVLGPVGFFVFVLIASIVLINIFLTLIISAFETVKHDIMKQNNEYEIVDFMMKKVKEMLGIDTSGTPESLKQELKQAKVEDQMTGMVVKLEQFLDFVNQYYFDGKLQSQAEDSKKMARVRSAFTRQRRYGYRRASKQVMGNGDSLSVETSIEPVRMVPQVSLLDWMEVAPEADEPGHTRF